MVWAPQTVPSFFQFMAQTNSQDLAVLGVICSYLMSMNGILTSLIRLLSGRVCKSGENSGKISPQHVVDAASSEMLTDKKTGSANSLLMN